MKKVFVSERAEEILKTKNEHSEGFFTEEKVSKLPEPIRKYLSTTGYMNTPIMKNADVVWKESFIRLQPDKDWLKLETKQYNGINPLVRIAYIYYFSW